MGKHAFLSASKYHWLRYDEEKLTESYDKHMTAARGTRLHDLAKNLIELGVGLPDTNQTLNLYVNDCIGYNMKPEQVLMYSYRAFGTVDAISFNNSVLRIFDLKNGQTPTKEDQLEIYDAFFCLEYGVKPHLIEHDLRIYQHDDIYRYDTDPERILDIMDLIVRYDKIIEAMEEV